MKASEFAKKISDLIVAHGDCEIVLLDPDTSWLLAPDLRFDEGNIEIVAEYDNPNPKRF